MSSYYVSSNGECMSYKDVNSSSKQSSLYAAMSSLFKFVPSNASSTASLCLGKLQILYNLSAIGGTWADSESSPGTFSSAKLNSNTGQAYAYSNDAVQKCFISFLATCAFLV